MATFDGQLYAGSWNMGSGDAEVWRTADGRTWDEITPPWSSQVSAVFDIENLMLPDRERELIELNTIPVGMLI